MSKNPVIARVTVDKHFSSAILVELRERFPDYNYLASKRVDGIHILEFKIKAADVGKFQDHHERLGKHRGELKFYTEIPYPALVAA
jgi:hypothetical protein